MSDNTTLNTGTGGDSIRDIDRSGSGPKTQVVQLDFGGAAPNAEQLASSTNPLPVNVYRIIDLLEALLIETRVHNQLLATLGQPYPDDPDKVRGDLSNAMFN